MLPQPANIEQFGQTLESEDIQRGLKELNPDFAFDVAVNRPSDWGHVLQFPDKRVLDQLRQMRLPVMHKDRYICGLDRGTVPEMKQWAIKRVIVEVPWSEADRDDVSIQYRQIKPWQEGYADLYELARKGLDPSYSIMPGGVLVQQRCMGYANVPGRVIMLGWRHTFERLIASDINNVTRRSIADKFHVDMCKIPTGQDAAAALLEE